MSKAKRKPFQDEFAIRVALASVPEIVNRWRWGYAFMKNREMNSIEVWEPANDAWARTFPDLYYHDAYTIATEDLWKIWHWRTGKPLR